VRRTNARGIAAIVALGLSACATLGVFGWANAAAPAVRSARGLPAGVSPLAVQPRVSASDEPLLVRVQSTRAPRWAIAFGIGALLIVTAIGRRAARERGHAWRSARAASALGRAPPRAVLTLS
jgi:hypothetical protein